MNNQQMSKGLYNIYFVRAKFTTEWEKARETKEVFRLVFQSTNSKRVLQNILLYYTEGYDCIETMDFNDTRQQYTSYDLKKKTCRKFCFWCSYFAPYTISYCNIITLDSIFIASK